MDNYFLLLTFAQKGENYSPGFAQKEKPKIELIKRPKFTYQQANNYNNYIIRKRQS
jgi:hypothetical protein